MQDSIGQLFTERPPVLFRIAQVVGITAGAYVLGQNAYISYGTVPAIMQAPAPLAARQWVTAYNRAKYTGPLLSIASGISCAYLAYNQHTSTLPFKLNLAAAILFPSIVPFTYLFIVPTNKALFAKVESLASVSLEDKAAEAEIAQEETTHALIDRWATLNMVRAVIIAAGVGLAAWAAADKREIVGFSEIAVDFGADRFGN